MNSEIETPFKFRGMRVADIRIRITAVLKPPSGSKEVLYAKSYKLQKAILILANCSILETKPSSGRATGDAHDSEYSIQLLTPADM